MSVIMISDDEIEKQRLADLAELSEVDADKFAPGSFGAHEALHTASVALDLVSRHLLEHPTIILDADFYRLANDAHTKLFELYQAIGAKHLEVEADYEEKRLDDLDASNDD